MVSYFRIDTNWLQSQLGQKLLQAVKQNGKLKNFGKTCKNLISSY
jgi:hypothetical protein